jgi:hypothetical protein
MLEKPKKEGSQTWLHSDCFVGYTPTEEGGHERRSDLHHHINDGVQPTDLVPAAHPHRKRDRCQCDVVLWLVLLKTAVPARSKEVVPGL